MSWFLSTEKDWFLPGQYRCQGEPAPDGGKYWDKRRVGVSQFVILEPILGITTFAKTCKLYVSKKKTHTKIPCFSEVQTSLRRLLESLQVWGWHRRMSLFPSCASMPGMGWAAASSGEGVDDGMTGWREDETGNFSVSFSKVFVVGLMSTHVELLNKGRHFWWSHVSQGGGGLFCILSLFYIYLGNLEVSNWVSDWVYLWLLCDFACLLPLVSFYDSDVLRIKSWGDAWSPSGTTRPKKVRCSEESAERAGPENQKSKRHASLPWSKDMKGKQSIQIWPNSDIRCTRVPCPAMPIPGRQPRMWNWQSRLCAFSFLSFFELSFTVKVLVANVGRSQASTDSFSCCFQLRNLSTASRC